eukprot:snap_masked-scaffold_20-processed-gene-3.14-mRNA-1 protein AED:0.19 eAED:0.19 QI:121/1/1/1/1/1/2/45/222
MFGFPRRKRDMRTLHYSANPNRPPLTLAQYTQRTLGSPNLHLSVRLPDGENLYEWISANTVDFYHNITLLYNLIKNHAEIMYPNPGDGFPPGFQYRFPVLKKNKKKIIKCSCGEYCELALSWAEQKLGNEEIFPVEQNRPFPENFMFEIKDIFKRLFRVFAILYASFGKLFQRMKATRHLNTSFKHFIYFSFQFKLLEETETNALKKQVAILNRNFQEKVQG